MKKALLCATAAATMVSAGATAYAQDGWYGVGKAGLIVDGVNDIDATTGAPNGRLDVRAQPEVDPAFGLGLGYGFDNGIRIEGVAGYRNVKLEVPDTFLGLQPPGTVGPTVPARRESRA